MKFLDLVKVYIRSGSGGAGSVSFRREKNISYVQDPPHIKLDKRTMALLASAVETLCDEMNLEIPWWCYGIPTLKTPYFVAGVENLKALSIMESPIHFRKRNIFVLGNFLERT